MNVTIFDVGHGACSVVTCPNGKRSMIDCGHHPDRPWRPSDWFSGQDIESLTISNYDEDHVSDLEALMSKTHVKFIARNQSVKSTDLAKLKMENGMGSGIARLHQWMKNTEGKPASENDPDFGAVRRTWYHNNYPSDFTDENNLSIVTIIEYSGFKILFGGDIEKDGWLKLITRQSFKRDLADINVFVASHHGRQDGCCDEVLSIAQPQVVVMSDRDKTFDSQETRDWYAERCRPEGVQYKDRRRYVFTTRSDGDISFSKGATGWTIRTTK